MTQIGSTLVEMKHAIQLMCSVMRCTECPKENGPLHISLILFHYLELIILLEDSPHLIL
jgi:hypothetical protein